MNPFLEAQFSPQVTFVPEIGRLVPSFKCCIEIHDQLLIARQDFIDNLSRNFTLQIGSTFLTATKWHSCNSVPSIPPTQPKNYTIPLRDIKRLNRKLAIKLNPKSVRFSQKMDRIYNPRGQKFQPTVNDTFTNTEIRNPPDFITFWDDLFIGQQRFLLVTHGFPETASIRDAETLAKLKLLIAEDFEQWSQGEIPQSVLYKSRVIPAYMTFMDAMPMINDLNRRRQNLSPMEMRQLCSQLEIQTDLFYSGKHSIQMLSVIEQEVWKSSMRTIDSIRDAIKSRFNIPSFQDLP